MKNSVFKNSVWAQPATNHRIIHTTWGEIMNIAYLSRQVEALTKRVETLEEIVHQKRNQAAAPSPALARKELKDFRDKETP